MSFRTRVFVSVVVAIVLAATVAMSSATGALVRPSLYRINAGGGAVTDSLGRKWVADEHFVGGRTHSVANTIAGTNSQALFRSQRWGMTGYEIPVSNGTYVVQLLLAEVNPNSGRRVFSATAEGAAIIANHRIDAAVGAYRANVVRSAPVKVSDGKVSLRFTATANSASVAGIELLSGAASSSPVTAVPAVPSVNGPWRLVFEDNFAKSAPEGSFLRSYPNWGAYAWGRKDTSRAGSYDPNILSAANGVMSMRLHTTTNGVRHVAAPYPRIGTADNNQLYGAYEVRARGDDVDGYKVAWLLWPKSENWPRDSEIDFPEADLSGEVSAFLHWQGGTKGSDQTHFGTGARFTDWHTYRLEWMPNRINLFLDGKQIGTSTHKIANTPMRYVLQTETQLSGRVPTYSSGKVQVDYVKVWKYAP